MGEHMRLNYLVSGFMSLCVLGTSPLMADSAPVETGELELRAAIVPSGYNKNREFIGYDDNDKILITVAGILPNTCYQPGSYTFDVSGNEIVIRQKGLEYKDSGKVCLQTKMPFFNDIDLGVISTANLSYKIVDGKTKNVIGKLPIAKSPVSEPDTDLYLSLTDARIWNDTQGGKSSWKVNVVGLHNSKCTRVKTVEVDVLEKERSIVVRPVLERVGTLTDDKCEPTERITATGTIDHDLKGIWLLHVRSVQGAGKHELVDIESLLSM
jgi:hypothetical protein